MTNDSESDKIEQKVMAEISSGRVKTRSKYIFLAEKLGSGGAFALTVIFAVLFFNLILFYLKASDNFSYLSFGSRGLLAFLESFPYLLVVVVVILVFIAGSMLRKNDLSYKEPFVYLAVGVTTFVVIVGVVLTLTSVAERIELETYSSRPTGMFFRPFLAGGLGERQYSVTGQIAEVGQDFIIVQTMHNRIKVDLSKLDSFLTASPGVGLFIMAIGNKNDDIFEAHNLRLIREGEIPMIQRGVRRRFGDFNTSTVQ